MRSDEEFVSGALVDFLGGPSYARATEGDDPPDLFLTIDGSRIGVEVTQLTQFTIDTNGNLGNRTTQDSYGIRLLNALNQEMGPLIPDGLTVCIGLTVPVSNPSRFEKDLTNWILRIASAPIDGYEEERLIDGSRTTASVVATRPSGKKVVGYVANRNTSADIGLNASLILADRIRTKTQICARLAKPVWLAMLNRYWLADAETYAVAGRQLELSHCFARIFLVSEVGAVHELEIGAK